MLKKEGLLVTANARIAPIATTVSPVPVLIERFYPPQRYSSHCAGDLSREGTTLHDGAHGASSTEARVSQTQPGSGTNKESSHQPKQRPDREPVLFRAARP